jgi:hypothetical protein
MTLEQLKERLKNPSVQGNATAKALLEKQIAAMEAKQGGDDKKEEPKATEPKKRGRKAGTKMPKKEPKPKVEKAPKVKKTYVAKKKDSDVEPDCDTLIAKFRERRAKAKANAEKRKTTPVFRKIASDVVDAVEKAIKNVPVETLKASPKETIQKFGKLRKSAESFLNDFRAILGNDYQKAQGEAELKQLESLIDKLVKKYKK